jgi:N-acetylglucosamine-6-phosphate deacetylase
VTELLGSLLVEGRLQPGRLIFEAGRITAIELDPSLANSKDVLPIVAPGLIDLHVHGFGGADAEDDVAAMALALARAGTTTFQPTLFPDEPVRLGATAKQVWAAAQVLDKTCARVLGLHLEGPFVNPLAAGALPPDRLAIPSVGALAKILGPSTGDGHGIRTMTIAPELSGSRELIEELQRAGVIPSLGHSRATYAEAKASHQSGRVGATHLFNAMPGIHHRELGLAGFALTAGVAHAEIIGDLAHVSGEAVDMALCARGPMELCLISDALPGAGTGCDVFHWNGRSHAVHEGAAWFDGGSGEQLAGSMTGQLEAVRGLVRRGFVTVEEGLAMASEAPARALGLEERLGVLRVGAHADLLVLEAENLGLQAVWVGGEAIPL